MSHNHKNPQENTLLEGFHAVVTGGSRGIGYAIAEALAKEGVFVSISGRNQQQLQQAAARIEEQLPEPYRGRISCIASDLEDPDAPAFIIEEAAKLHQNRLDILINNAGLSLSAAFSQSTPSDWDQVMQVNAKAPYFLCQKALPFLEASEYPAIVQIASVVAFKGYEAQSVYTASKHALLGFTKAISKELLSKGIRVFTLSPGGVATDMVTSMRPDIDTEELIQPEEIARTVIFLLESRGNGMIDSIEIRRASKQPWL